ncbi:MAG: YggS family pyridoxal phosphate-dependent enzyme [Gammaproteobacteria bacterium]|nr:YggS family pyridoxal phosphate-dependent enzyme [Gammaproteobacteria bacterium]
MANIKQQLSIVIARIRAAEARFGRQPGSVALIAVSKTFPLASLQEAMDAGQHRFGESYLQEALPKIEALTTTPNLEWHFIGPIQSNKTRPIAQHFAWVHSVDRIKIAQRLSEQRPPELPPLNLCLQVNISGENSKSGTTADELLELARAVNTLPRLKLRGLMAIPAPVEHFDAQRAVFAQVRQLQENLIHAGLALDTLSMGMSDDLEAAIAEGATLVRVGRSKIQRRGAEENQNLTTQATKAHNGNREQGQYRESWTIDGGKRFHMISFVFLIAPLCPLWLTRFSPRLCVSATAPCVALPRASMHSSALDFFGFWIIFIRTTQHNENTKHQFHRWRQYGPQPDRRPDRRWP